MPTSGWTRIVIALAAGAWILIVLASGDHIDASWIKPLGLASSLVVWALLVFDRWAWRWPGLRRLARRPVLHGTWRGELRTSYCPRKDEVIRAYMVIRQTYSSTLIAMLFDRSQSISMSGSLVVEGGRWVLYYVFRSDKQTLERDENPPARGAAELTVSTRPSTRLEGDYWMEHGTRGHFTTVGFNPGLFDTFGAAEEATFT